MYTMPKALYRIDRRSILNKIISVAYYLYITLRVMYIQDTKYLVLITSRLRLDVVDYYVIYLIELRSIYTVIEL